MDRSKEVVRELNAQDVSSDEFVKRLIEVFAAGPALDTNTAASKEEDSGSLTEAEEREISRLEKEYLEAAERVERTKQECIEAERQRVRSRLDRLRYTLHPKVAAGEFLPELIPQEGPQELHSSLRELKTKLDTLPTLKLRAEACRDSWSSAMPFLTGSRSVSPPRTPRSSPTPSSTQSIKQKRFFARQGMY